MIDGARPTSLRLGIALLATPALLVPFAVLRPAPLAINGEEAREKWLLGLPEALSDWLGLAASEPNTRGAEPGTSTCYAISGGLCLEWQIPNKSAASQVWGCSPGSCNAAEDAVAVPIEQGEIKGLGAVRVAAYRLADANPTRSRGVPAQFPSPPEDIGLFRFTGSRPRDMPKLKKLDDAPNQSSLPPIILVTGLTGSSLYATTRSDKVDFLRGGADGGDAADEAAAANEAEAVGAKARGWFPSWPEKCGPNYMCPCELKDKVLWLDIKDMLPLLIDCTFDRLRLEWDSSTKTYRDNGVRIRTKFYGEPDCKGCTMGAPAFFAIRQALVEALGYPEDNSRFYDVVYDYRLGPREWRSPQHASSFYMTGDFERMKGLVEEATGVAAQKAVVISISEGGVFANNFFHEMSDTWKAEHILGWVSMATPFAGATEIGIHFLSGDPNYKEIIPWLDTEKFRSASEAWSGLMAVAPIPTGMPSDKEPFVLTPSRNYTIETYPAAIKQAGHLTTADVWDHTIPLLVEPTVSPGLLPTLCQYGTGVKTIVRASYKTDDLSDDPSLEWTKPEESGDGTVHLDSLNACLRWSDASEVTVKEYQEATHMGLFSDVKAVTDLVCWISGLTSGAGACDPKILAAATGAFGEEEEEEPSTYDSWWPF